MYSTSKKIIIIIGAVVAQSI